MKKKENNTTVYDEQIDSRFLHLRKGTDERTIKEEIARGNTPVVYFWNDLVVYHDKEYLFCSVSNIPYKKDVLGFDSETDVINWICGQELMKDDLANETRKYLMGKRYHCLISISKKKTPSAKSSIQILLGKEYRISNMTVYKYAQYASAIDCIREKDPTVASKILKGNIRMSHENTVKLSMFPKDDFFYLKELFHKEEPLNLTLDEIKHELRWQKAKIQATNKPPRSKNLPIKDMPTYSPDSEVASLIFTIPSWISSIQRTHTKTDFILININTKIKLKDLLEHLDAVVNDMIKNIVEES